MEYYIEGFKDYVYDKDNEYIYCYEKEKNEIEKDKKKTKMLGRADILLISKPNENNKIKLYFIEVKNGTGAYSGVSNKFITKENNGSVFGAGIIGHINNYVPIINAINSKSEAGQKIKSQYIKDRSSRDRANEKLSELNIKKYMEEEIRNKMSNYNYLELIENDNFKKINYEEIKIESAELIFYLGDCNPKEDFFKYLGIEGPSELKLKEYTKAKYSLVNLLNKTEEYEKLGLKFIENEDMIDFKYYIDCDNNQEIDINIENYKIISKDNFEIKVE